MEQNANILGPVFIVTYVDFKARIPTAFVSVHFYHLFTKKIIEVTNNVRIP